MREVPRWAGVAGVLVALAVALHGCLPLLHAVLEHTHGPTAVAHAASGASGAGGGEPGGTAAPGEESPRHDEDGCPTCHDLTLVKQAVPWRPPVLVPRPICAGRPEARAVASRVLPVGRSAAPARGPPARA